MVPMDVLARKQHFFELQEGAGFRSLGSLGSTFGFPIAGLPPTIETAFHNSMEKLPLWATAAFADRCDPASDVGLPGQIQGATRR